MTPGSICVRVETVVGADSKEIGTGEVIWDVCVIHECIYASVHGCTKSGGRVHVYNMNGDLQKIISCKFFNEPNMMDVQW
jgi:hypothetical protein